VKRVAGVIAAFFIAIAFIVQPAVASAAPSVQPLLLTVTDMPIGWASYPLSSPVAQGCWSPFQDLLARHPASWAGTNYQDFDGSAFATEALFSWPSLRGAQQAWASTNAQLSPCHEFVSAEGSATQIELLNLGRIGDVSAAWFATNELGWGFAVVLARKGPVVAALVYSVPVVTFKPRTVVPFFQSAVAKVSTVLAVRAVQPVIFTAFATPALVGPHGGRVTLRARLRGATTCQLELLSRQSFAVAYADNIRSCRATFTAHLTIGANPTRIERHVAFALIARNGAKSFTARFWVGLAQSKAGSGGSFERQAEVGHSRPTVTFRQ
jgi:hypothetical protein